MTSNSRTVSGPAPAMTSNSRTVSGPEPAVRASLTIHHSAARGNLMQPVLLDSSGCPWFAVAAHSYHGGMMQLCLLVAALFVLSGCVNGRNGYSNEALPQPAGHLETTVTTGRPGDQWLDTMQFVRVARARRGSQLGYEVSYSGARGTLFTLFWSRDQIDFRGTAPERFHLDSRPLGTGTLRYPNKITSQSLPEVHRAIVILEHDYGKYADGEITWAQATADVAALGVGGPGIRTTATGGPPRIPPARAGGAGAVTAGAKGYKPFTAANFRENLARLTGVMPKNAHAHHIFPQKHASAFQKTGINIHDPRYGAWWQASSHQSNAAKYNLQWDDFLDPSRTMDEILQYGRKLASDYGLTIYF